MDNICGICGESSKKYIYKLNCSHVFHYECLSQSFKFGLNQNCPLCRESGGFLPINNISNRHNFR